MTWQPSDREVAAYIEGAGVAAMSDGLPAVNRAQYVARAGLQAAYEKLEARVGGGTLYQAPRPLVHYAEANDLDDVNSLAKVGWRIVCVYGPRDAPRYVLEREREPSTSDGAG